MNKILKLNGKLKKVQVDKDQIILEYEDDCTVENMESIPIGVEDKNVVSLPIREEEKNSSFIGKILEHSEVTYNILSFPKSKYPEDFLDILSKLENNVSILDYRTGQRIYARKDNKQLRISGLKNVLSRYPSLTAGDIIGVAIRNDELVIDFQFGVKMDMREMLEKIGSTEWFEKELLPYDVQYRVIGLNTRSYPSEFMDNLPKLGTEFKILDIRTGKTCCAYMNTKQYQISSVKPLYDQYPDIKIGNIIRIANSPENKNEVWVDFKFQDEIKKAGDGVAKTGLQ